MQAEEIRKHTSLFLGKLTSKVTFSEASKFNFFLLLGDGFLTFWRRIFFQILAHPVFKM